MFSCGNRLLEDTMLKGLGESGEEYVNLLDVKRLCSVDVTTLEEKSRGPKLVHLVFDCVFHLLLEYYLTGQLV